jgi:hypothetical protein
VTPATRPLSEWQLRSGRIEARIGLRMMPTFPRSPLSFRTADDHVDGVAIENAYGGHPTQHQSGPHTHTFEGARRRFCEVVRAFRAPCQIPTFTVTTLL